MKIATLGPVGTCSGEVANSYIADLGLSPETLELCSSYEEAVNLVLTGTADQVVVPAAYMNFHEIVFRNVRQLRVCEILFSQTPSFVLAVRRGLTINEGEGRLIKVASHHAPASLMDKLKFLAERVDAPSNSSAAWMVSEGKADVCITQSTSIEAVNSTSPTDRQLDVIERFGSVDMVWAVFGRGVTSHGRHFWRGHFEEQPNSLSSLC
jgi:hypothetical protein